LTVSGSAGVAVPDDLVLVAHVTGAFGIAGWVRLRPYSEEASALFHAKTWWVDKPTLHDVDVMQLRAQGEDVVARLMGIGDRDAAEALKGATIQVRRAHFPPLEDNEFYWVDLVGHTVENLRGELMGEVSGLLDNGAHPILRVSLPAAEGQKSSELLIPFVEQYVTEVDQTAKRITVDWERDY